MSIATDEAEKNYPNVTGWIYRSSERRAYAAGRKAEPTEEEIEAAAHRLYEVTHAHESDSGWYAISEIRHETYREQAAVMLEAARQAVSE